MSISSRVVRRQVLDRSLFELRVFWVFFIHVLMHPLIARRLRVDAANQYVWLENPMSDGPNAALIAQLHADEAVIRPQVRGLNDLARSSLSEALETIINTVRAGREHRRALIRARLATLAADD